MYCKIIAFLCAASLVSTGHLLEADAPLAYHSASSVSSSSFSSHTAHSYTTAFDYRSYAGIPLLAYTTTPIVLKSYAPIYTHSTPIVYAKHYVNPAITAYTASIYGKSKFIPTPAVSYASVFTHSAALPYAITTPSISKTYVIPTIGAHTLPIYAKSITPAISYTSLYGHSIPLTYAAAAPTMTKTYTVPSYLRKTTPSSHSSYSTQSPLIDCDADHDVAKTHEPPIITKFSAAPGFKSVRYTSVVDK